MRKRVITTGHIDPVCADKLAEHFDVIATQDYSSDGLIRQIKGVHGLVLRGGSCSRALLAAADVLEAVGRHGVGYDTVDVDACTEAGLVVFNTPRANSTAVAEAAVTLIMVLAKRIVPTHELVKSGQFARARRDYPGTELKGKTLGLVGFGNIGRQVARRCGIGLEMTVLAYDPYATTVDRNLVGDVTIVKDLDEVLTRADFVSMHSPLSDETRGIISTRELALMKPTAFIVNCARGGLIDEPALAEALRNHQIAGAGIDVFEEEPPPTDHPFLTLDNVILTSHIAGVSPESMRNMASDVADGMIVALSGQRPPGLLNPRAYEVRAKAR